MSVQTKVLAIASHVTYGYVGNTMATFVMQSLGCEVAAINTVHFSNHTGYGQWKGCKTSASEVRELYEGLKASHLTDFDVMLSGYIPSIEVLREVERMADELKPIFWILDPVMGDQGRLYVDDKLVDGYKNLVRKADMVLPNQFEIEQLTGIEIRAGWERQDIVEAIQKLHRDIRHIVVTSVRLQESPDTLYVVGSSCTSTGQSRVFAIDVPVLDCFFSGTGDMFAGLMVARFTQNTKHFDDDTSAVDLPLAQATCQVLDSMQMVLERTMTARKEEIEGKDPKDHLAMTKAAEVRVVQNVGCLQFPQTRYMARHF